MGKNDNFTTSASGAADVNKVLEAKSRTSIFRDEVFKDIVRYKFTAAIIIKYTLSVYQDMHPVEIARLIKDTRERTFLSDEEVLQDEIDTLNLTLGTGAEKNTENDFVFEIYTDKNRSNTNLVTINIEMQDKFSGERPNTISRAVYYGGTLLRNTVPAGDRYYSGMHKVYTIWLCNSFIRFRTYSAEEICKTLNQKCFLYKHKYNIRRGYDDFPDYLVPKEPESDLMEVVFVELPVLREKIESGTAEKYEELFLQFIENIQNSLALMEKEYNINLMKYEKGVKETMSIAERYELRLKQVEEEANREKEKAIYCMVKAYFKVQFGKDEAYASILEDNPDISTESLKAAIQQIYEEA